MGNSFNADNLDNTEKDREYESYSGLEDLILNSNQIYDSIVMRCLDIDLNHRVDCCRITIDAKSGYADHD